MESTRRLILFVTTLTVVFGFLSIAVPLFAASKEKLLHTFGTGKDGWAPGAGLILDAAGNLYGTTVEGGIYGAYGDGTVFQLSPRAKGAWKENVLHSFGKGKDGTFPSAALILDATGNLYGTTRAGGTGKCRDGFYGNIIGCGTVFQMTPVNNGKWTEKVLHSFQKNGYDGTAPYARLIFDAAGNLYGTTSAGGAGQCQDSYGNVVGCGTVFQLAPGADGQWVETVLHRFRNNGKDGTGPAAGLIFDAAGNLYGTTNYGGASGTGCDSSFGCGAVFELTPAANGTWTEKVLHNFQNNGKDGTLPVAGLVFDAAGNLYGTTSAGGPGQCEDYYGFVIGCGTVFQMTPGTKGKWMEKVLHHFNYDGKDGNSPQAGVTFDATGNLYGTTLGGGADGYGSVFRLAPGTNGKWTEEVLHSFNINGKDGFDPWAGVIFDAAGNLYGTTIYGGASGGCGTACGTVFEITP
jgi:uncharacterized repeat protein (TIGR03803 family)